MSTKKSFTDFADNEGQLTLSYELLILLQWLVHNEKNALKSLIQKSLKRGLIEFTDYSDTLKRELISWEAHHDIADFFNSLESILLEALNDQAMKHVLKKNLLPALEHIDTSLCDKKTVRFSAEKTAVLIKKNPKTNPQEMLFKEILRHWKPKNKNIKH